MRTPRVRKATNAFRSSNFVWSLVLEAGSCVSKSTTPRVPATMVAAPVNERPRGGEFPAPELEEFFAEENHAIRILLSKAEKCAFKLHHAQFHSARMQDQFNANPNRQYIYGEVIHDLRYENDLNMVLRTLELSPNVPRPLRLRDDDDVRDLTGFLSNFTDEFERVMARTPVSSIQEIDGLSNILKAKLAYVIGQTDEKALKMRAAIRIIEAYTASCMFIDDHKTELEALQLLFSCLPKNLKILSPTIPMNIHKLLPSIENHTIKRACYCVAKILESEIDPKLFEYTLSLNKDLEYLEQVCWTNEADIGYIEKILWTLSDRAVPQAEKVLITLSECASEALRLYRWYLTKGQKLPDSGLYKNAVKTNVKNLKSTIFGIIKIALGTEACDHVFIGSAESMLHDFDCMRQILQKTAPAPRDYWTQEDHERLDRCLKSDLGKVPDINWNDAADLNYGEWIALLRLEGKVLIPRVHHLLRRTLAGQIEIPEESRLLKQIAYTSYKKLSRLLYERPTEDIWTQRFRSICMDIAEGIPALYRSSLLPDGMEIQSYPQPCDMDRFVNVIHESVSNALLCWSLRNCSEREIAPLMFRRVVSAIFSDTEETDLAFKLAQACACWDLLRWAHFGRHLSKIPYSQYMHQLSISMLHDANSRSNPTIVAEGYNILISMFHDLEEFDTAEEIGEFVRNKLREHRQELRSEQTAAMGAMTGSVDVPEPIH